MIVRPSQIGVNADELSVRSLIYFFIELENLLHYIGKRLHRNGESVAIAEGVTSGFLQFSFSQMKNANQFYKGGLTTYTLEDAVNLLNITDNINTLDFVSGEIVEKMALKVAHLFKSDWSLAVTGFSSAAQSASGKLFCYLSIAYKGTIILTEKLDLHSRTKSVNAQLYYSEFILGCFKIELDKQYLHKESDLENSKN